MPLHVTFSACLQGRGFNLSQKRGTAMSAPHVLRFVVEDIGRKTSRPMPLSRFVAGVLTVGVKQRGKKSVSQATHSVLRQLVIEGMFEFDEETRQYKLIRSEQIAI